MHLWVCVWLTPGPRPELWSHTRGLKSATHCTDLGTARLCAPWGVLRFCSGVNGLNHSSPWRASGQSLSPSQKAYIPTFSPTALSNCLIPIGNLYALSSSCHSWFTFGGLMELLLKVRLWKAIFLTSYSLTHYICHSSLSLRPLSCLFARSLTH